MKTSQNPESIDHLHGESNLDQNFLEIQLKGMPTKDLLAYKEYQQHTHNHLKKASITDKLVSAFKHMDRFGEDKASLDQDIPLMSNFAEYASMTVVPATVGLLTSTALKAHDSSHHVAKGIGAAIATAGFELASGIGGVIDTQNIQRDYEARKITGFVDKELARRQLNGEMYKN